MKTCTQLDHDVSITELPESAEGYEGCLAIGSCCKDSLHRYATAQHAASAGHPIIRSLQLGGDWSWYFVDRLAMLISRCRTVLVSRRHCWHRSRA
jgi:hypothetical protein